MHNATPNGSSLAQFLGRRWALLVVGILSISGVTAYGFRQVQSSRASVEPTPAAIMPEIKTVTALGRLEPSSQVVQLSAPASAEGSRVEQLLVQEGDQVTAGQVIAILDSRDRRQAALEEAQTQAKVAQAHLAQVRVGAKQGDIKAQAAKFQRAQAELDGQIAVQQASIAALEAQSHGETSAQTATIDRLQAELSNAQTECDRYQRLYASGAISASQRDSTCLQEETADKSLQEAQAILDRIVASRREQINQARANLNRTVETVQRQIQENRGVLEALAHVRPVDIQVAAAELEAAQAVVKRTQTELDLAYVRSPIAGQVIEIHSHAGEAIDPEKGIAAVGQTSQMVAIVEVYESDISKIHPGQSAQVVSDSLPSPLQGTVETVGLQILRQNVVNADPSANIDARIVEVRVRLDQASSQKVAAFTNLQVRVVVEL